MKKRLPIFTTPEGRAEYIAAYEAMFSLWTVTNDAVDVKTGYGSTHINVSGPSDGHPLVLLHGAGLSSTAWFANIAALSANHRVYIVCRP
jgi:pimeloyl-ACP methyl ester carboxylesterase